MNYHFNHCDLKICFMKSIWRSNGQHYSLALKTWDDVDMQYNVSKVKWEVQNGVSTGLWWKKYNFPIKTIKKKKKSLNAILKMILLELKAKYLRKTI